MGCSLSQSGPVISLLADIAANGQSRRDLNVVAGRVKHTAGPSSRLLHLGVRKI